jgi:hypothetical protein
VCGLCLHIIAIQWRGCHLPDTMGRDVSLMGFQRRALARWTNWRR